MVDRISLVKQFLNLRSDNNIQIGLGLNSTRGVLSNAGVKAFILSAELVGYQVTSVFFQDPSEIFRDGKVKDLSTEIDSGVIFRKS